MALVKLERKRNKKKIRFLLLLCTHSKFLIRVFFLCVCAAVVVHKIPSVVIKIQVKWRTHKKRAGKM